MSPTIIVCAAAACLAFSLGVVMTPLVRRLAFAVGAVDKPDGKRKIHTKPTASWGGLAIAAAFFGGVLIAGHLATGIGRIPLVRLLLPSLFPLAVGMWDDVKSSRPRVKLLLQFMAAGSFWLAGVRIERMLGFDMYPVLSLLVTVIWLTACANAVNLFDGMDGLAAGLAIFVSLVLVVLSTYQGKTELAVLAAALAGSAGGFLLFNFPPAVIFMGDTGALFLGMMLGALAIEGSFKSHLTFALAVPILALGLPLLDTLLAVLRRVERRVSVFSPDKDHLHHRLIKMGFSRREALVLLYGLIVVMASIAIVVAFSNSVVAGVLIVAGGLVIAAVARLLGASELQEVGFLLVGGLGRRRILAHHRRLVRDGAAALGKATEPGAAIDRALADLRALGFDAVEIEWQGHRYAADAGPPTDGKVDAWRWRTNLLDRESGAACLTLTQRGGPEQLAPEVAPLAADYAKALSAALSRASGMTSEAKVAN